MRLAHVHLHKASVGLMHAGHHFTRFKMDNICLFETFVRGTPADDGNLKHWIWQSIE